MPTLDQNTLATNKANTSNENIFVIYSKKMMTSFFDLRFSEVLRNVQKKTNEVFGILILSKKQ